MTRQPCLFAFNQGDEGSTLAAHMGVRAGPQSGQGCMLGVKAVIAGVGCAGE